MSEITLVRSAYLPTATVGTIFGIDGKPFCLSIERPWKDNEPFVSCIPSGLYEATKDQRHRGQKDEITVWELSGVPSPNGKGRDQIQFHIANRASELSGCIAPVSWWNIARKEVFGSASGRAFKLFMAELDGRETVEILITNSPINLP